MSVYNSATLKRITPCIVGIVDSRASLVAALCSDLNIDRIVHTLLLTDNSRLNDTWSSFMHSDVELCINGCLRAASLQTDRRELICLKLLEVAINNVTDLGMLIQLIEFIASLKSTVIVAIHEHIQTALQERLRCIALYFPYTSIVAARLCDLLSSNWPDLSAESALILASARTSVVKRKTPPPAIVAEVVESPKRVCLEQRNRVVLQSIISAPLTTESAVVLNAIDDSLDTGSSVKTHPFKGLEPYSPPTASIGPIAITDCAGEYSEFADNIYGGLFGGDINGGLFGGDIYGGLFGGDINDGLFGDRDPLFSLSICTDPCSEMSSSGTPLPSVV